MTIPGNRLKQISFSQLSFMENLPVTGTNISKNSVICIISKDNRRLRERELTMGDLTLVQFFL